MPYCQLVIEFKRMTFWRKTNILMKAQFIQLKNRFFKSLQGKGYIDISEAVMTV
tara:strand:+ start:3433 stop:3594 length:162 start_codon:yes stop_codon:yes gene_type:complete